MDKNLPPPPRSDREKEIEFLRAALRRRVEQTSIRQVAAEVKMSHGGIYNLVTGQAAPYGKTLAKLRTWYLTQWASGDEGLSTDTGRYLLRQMVAHMSPSVRGRAADELLDAIEVLHRKYATPPPAWVHEVRRELRAGADLQKRGGSGTGIDGS
jgi:AcrR family transcriptional regulator